MALRPVKDVAVGKKMAIILDTTPSYCWPFMKNGKDRKHKAQSQMRTSELGNEMGFQKVTQCKTRLALPQKEKVLRNRSLSRERILTVSLIDSTKCGEPTKRTTKSPRS